MKKNGMTLVEMIGVIFVIALIALITTPAALKVLGNSKKQIFKESVNGIVDAVRVDNANQDYVKENYVVTNGKIVSSSGRGLTKDGGSDENGTVYINEEGDIALTITNGRYCAKKDISEGKISITNYDDKTCDTMAYEPVKTIEDLVKIAPKEGTEKESGKGRIINLGERGIRYQGEDPDNYIIFNDEIWRIIGIFDGKLKVIKDEKLDVDKEWDETVHTASHDRPGDNNWSVSTLYNYLNNSYYYDIKENDRNIIENTTWFLGSLSSHYIEKDGAYSDERDSSRVNNNNPATLNAKMGLIYVSDYGYAAGAECSGIPLAEYNTDICKKNNWIVKETYSWWTITPMMDRNEYAFLITDQANLAPDNVENAHGIRPSLYLTSNIKFKGEGTKQNPYKLKY